jgi:hypothetical protein
MPRKRTYTPGTEHIPCRDCGVPKTITEYYMRGDRTGVRQPCKECYNEHKRQTYYHGTGYSNCTNCEYLEACRAIVDTLELLPCQEGYKPPKSAYYPFIEIILEKEIIQC